MYHLMIEETRYMFSAGNHKCGKSLLDFNPPSARDSRLNRARAHASISVVQKAYHLEEVAGIIR